MEQVAGLDRTVVNHDFSAEHDETFGLMSSVDRFLLACATLELNREAEQKILCWLQNEIEWDSIISRAVRHGLIPLLYHHLSRPSFREYVPENVLNTLKNGFFSSAANALRAYTILENVLGTLNKSGIEPIILKGPALIESLYPDPALRPFSDIDLLIREEDWAVVRSSLLKLGFKPVKNDCPILPPRLIPSDMLDHWFAFHDKNGFHIDCKFDPLELGLRAKSLDSIWQRALDLKIGSAKARRLSLEDELLMLCVHLNRHGYQRLIWFLDIAKFIKAYKAQINWRALSELTKAENILPSMFNTLTYTNRLFGRLVPADIVCSFKPPWLGAKIWQSNWPEEAVLTFSGTHEAALVFYKSIWSKWLVPNLLLTGRSGEKVGYFLRKLIPSRNFLSEKYGLSGAKNSYFGLMLKRCRTVFQLNHKEMVFAGNDPVLPVKELTATALRCPEIKLEQANAYIEKISIINPKDNNPIKASVIIVTYDHVRFRLLFSCLDGLDKQSYRAFELIIVCNGSVKSLDQSALKRYPFPITLVGLKQNYKPSLARNIGAELAVGDIVCFLDDDAIPDVDFVSKHVEAYEKEGVIAVRGRIKPLDTNNRLNFIEDDGDLGEIQRPYLLDREGNMSIRREWFRRVGGFDPSLYGHEGTDLTYRLITEGVSRVAILYCPKAVIFHDHGFSVIDALEKHFRWGRKLAKLAKAKPEFIEFIKSYAVQHTGEKRRRPLLKEERLFLRSYVSMIGELSKFAGKIGWRYEVLTDAFSRTILRRQS